MLRFASRAAQAATYNTGSPNYVDCSAGAAAAGSVTIPAKATDDSWADGDTVPVFVAVDEDNWWLGIGTWDETNSYMELTTEEDSAGTLSNAAAVTITATITAEAIAEIQANATGGRELLTADRTYYVATTGSDSNDGLTVGNPFLTIQKAVDVICSIDCGIYQATIQIADGTYTEEILLGNTIGSEIPIIKGNPTTPANVLISATGNAIDTLPVGGKWRLESFRLVATGTAIKINSNGYIEVDNIVFGESGKHIQGTGGYFFANGSYSIDGGAEVHYQIGANSVFVSKTSITITVTNTPNFSSHFAWAYTGGVGSFYLLQFSGAATGKRYSVDTNGVINTYGGSGTNPLPGNAAGTTATGGIYA
jgi:hypothetical protein